MKFWKKDNDDILCSPLETLGFSKEKNYLQVSSIIQKFLIKKFDFSSIKQISDIKKQLLGRNILIINAKEFLENGTIPIQELKKGIDELKSFLNKHGGSIGRLGNQYLILTPCPQIKIAN